MARIVASAVCLATLVLAGCSASGCPAGARRACVCPDGDPAFQFCADGTRWGECPCSRVRDGGGGPSGLPGGGPSASGCVPEAGMKWTFEGEEAGAYRTGGDAPWGLERGDGHESFRSLRSGDIDDSERSALFLDVDFSVRTDLTFWARTDTEGCCDDLTVFVNGERGPRWSGDEAWTLVDGISIPAGPHTVEWRFVKDGSISTEADAVWVDDVTFVSSDETCELPDGGVPDGGHVDGGETDGGELDGGDGGELDGGHADSGRTGSSGPGVQCGSMRCTADLEVCCVGGAPNECGPMSAFFSAGCGAILSCDEPGDCPTAEGTAQQCCLSSPLPGLPPTAQCRLGCRDDTAVAILCLSDSDCAFGACVFDDFLGGAVGRCIAG